MKPGRELDALVAERVMGWVWKKPSGLYVEGDPTGEVLHPPKGQLQFVPPFSTNTAAAFDMVQSIQSKKSMSVQLCLGVQTALAQFHTQYGKTVSQGYSESVEHRVPHALCLAALAAVGDEI